MRELLIVVSLSQIVVSLTTTIASKTRSSFHTIKLHLVGARLAP